MSVHEHKEKGKKSIRCFVITVSDTRDESTDTSGQTIKKFLADEAHEATGYRIVKDEPVEIEKLLNEALGQERCRCGDRQRRHRNCAAGRNL